jgi:uncharacterized protein (DUF2336 family)
MLHGRPTPPLPFRDSLERTPGPDSRRILLRIATDQFISLQSHSVQQIAHFEKTVGRLIGKADPATRLIVARKVATHPMTPPRVFEMIETMGGEAALHILEHAPLPRERLLAAALGNESRASALARRSDLDSDIVATLSARPEFEVVLALVGNLAAPIGPAAFATLARRAEHEKPLAEALLARPSDDVDSASLFILATSEQRAAILAAAQRAELPRAVGASSYGRDNAETIALLENYALEREPTLFNAALAQALGCSLDLAERIAKEPSGEPLAVSLAALGAAQDATVRILVSGDLQSGARYTRIGSLVRLKDGLNPAAARRVIAALIGAPKERRERHQHRPVLDSEASATASRAAPALKEPDAPRRRVFAFPAQGAAKSR